MKAQISPEEFRKLRRFNLIISIIYFLQAVFIFSASFVIESVKNFNFEMLNGFLQFFPEEGYSPEVIENYSEFVLNVPFAMLLGGILLISAITHFVIASRKFNSAYNRGLQNGANKPRWFEYAVSNSIIIGLVALLIGVNLLYIIISLIALVVISNMMGLVMEQSNKDEEKIKWTSLIVGVFSNLLVWYILYKSMNNILNPTEITLAITIIFYVCFVLSNLFILITILQQKGNGKWKSYLHAEKSYILLSLIFKAFLTWGSYIFLMKG